MSELTSIGYPTKTMEDLQKLVPAAFSNSPHPERTDRYSLFSTVQFLEAFEKLGWTPYSAKQHGSNPYSRHIIRLHNPDMGYIPVFGDKIKPHLMLDNSHDGYTPGQIHLGLFRLICENGLVIGIPGLNSTVKFRHVGLNQKEMIQIIAETAEQYRSIGDHVYDMQQVIMNVDQKEDFVMKTLGIREPARFLNEDGTINRKVLLESLDPRELFKPIRPQDEKDDLWTIFNVIQERTVQGLFEMKSATGRKSSPRTITNAARHLDYNRKLWKLAETYMPEEAEIVS